MGKNLKGKELGTGISQRKDGLYTARFTDEGGKRVQKYFHTVKDAKKWLVEGPEEVKKAAEKEREDSAFSDLLGANPTMDRWFAYWMKYIKTGSVRETTRALYEQIYRVHVHPVLGDKPLRSILPIHCRQVLSAMAENKKNGTITNVRRLLKSVFASAVENELIEKNPVTKNVQITSEKETTPRPILTKEEQKTFLQVSANSKYKEHFAFVLQTGMRVGELQGLTWDDVDFDHRVIHVRKSINKNGKVSPPKTKSGVRDIPMTTEAFRILKSQQKRNALSVFCFASDRGKPIRPNQYHRMLQTLTRKYGLPGVSMHCLRHTFATRCIEAGMRPKTLQTILGHSTLAMTMDLYVHVTESEAEKEMQALENLG